MNNIKKTEKLENHRLRVIKVKNGKNEIISESYYVGDRRVYLTNWFKKHARKQGISL